MIRFIENKKQTKYHRLICAVVLIAFVFTGIIPPSYAQIAAQTVLNLPVPGAMVPVSSGYIPTLIKGITIHPENQLLFDFIVDTGDSQLQGKELTDEAVKLIKYFLASLTVPEDEMWVNLSPYEKDRVVPDGFGVTEMGRDLLAQDYILKQLTSTLVYPEDELGKTFWARVYEKTQKEFNTTDIPMNTFNKIWILPEKAAVYEHGNSVFVVESHLKVMLEEDFVALNKNLGIKSFGLEGVEKESAEKYSAVSSKIIKEILIPEIEKEVNEGKNFAQLRQIYNSVILASWYKENLKESLLGQVYVGKNKTFGVDVEDKEIKQRIYNQYLEAFKKGVYNYIKEDYDSQTKTIIPRKYFSGGSKMGNVKVAKRSGNDVAMLASRKNGDVLDFRTNLADAGEGALPGAIAEADRFAEEASSGLSLIAVEPGTDEAIFGQTTIELNGRQVYTSELKSILEAMGDDLLTQNVAQAAGPQGQASEDVRILRFNVLERLVDARMTQAVTRPLSGENPLNYVEFSKELLASLVEYLKPSETGARLVINGAEMYLEWKQAYKEADSSFIINKARFWVDFRRKVADEEERLMRDFHRGFLDYRLVELSRFLENKVLNVEVTSFTMRSGSMGLEWEEDEGHLKFSIRQGKLEIIFNDKDVVYTSLISYKSPVQVLREILDVSNYQNKRNLEIKLTDQTVKIITDKIRELESREAAIKDMADNVKKGGDIVGLHSWADEDTLAGFTAAKKAGLNPELKGPQQTNRVRSQNPQAILLQTVKKGGLSEAVRAGADVLISSEMLLKGEIAQAREDAKEKNILIIAGINTQPKEGEISVQSQIAMAFKNGADGVKFKPAGRGLEYKVLDWIEIVRERYPTMIIMVAGGVTNQNRNQFGPDVIAGIGADSLREINSIANWAVKKTTTDTSMLATYKLPKGTMEFGGEVVGILA
ncbi:MAG: hypothetical protein HQL27_01185, partial [Candidatus Omnitrophica bacterium]|nr:hypothetical protein [Candidatus Omnitrophota bacterium]